MIEITKEQANGYYVIKIEGDVDASSSIHLDQAIDDAIKDNHQKILIDCQKLSYISSAGLGVFMSHIEEFKAKNMDLVLFGLNEKVKNVFQILGLDQLLTIVDTRENAKQVINDL